VCQASFRGTRLCSRCGVDLGPLMVLAITAWQRRRDARQAIATSDYVRAIELVDEAEGFQGTLRGRALRTLAAWLLAKSGAPIRAQL
jgi:hypothetical protein